MHEKSDAQLLRDYAQHGDEAAFAELVSRHTNLVYSAAVRQVDSPDLAAEVAQSVFLGLARGARSLSPRLTEDASLAGWLCRSARNLALNLRRDEFRRHSRERQAMEHPDSIPETVPDWDKLRPVLDAAMSDLDETDYDALVLRFFKNQDLEAVGQALGVSDDTAQKRVVRALDKLREHLSRRGIRTTAAALSVVLTANAVQAAPVGLAVTISTAAALAGTNLATTTAATVIKTIAMTTLQKTLITTTILAAVGTGIYEARQVSSLRDQVQTLQQQQDPLAKQIQQLQRERGETTRQLAALRDDNERLGRNTGEFLKLRGEVARLRQSQNDLVTGRKPTTQREESPSGLLEWKPEQLTNAGRAMPHDALQTFLWAGANTNLAELANCIVPDAGDPPSDEAIQSYVKDPLNHLVNGFRKFSVLSQTNISPDEVQLELQGNTGAGGFSKTLALRNAYGEWKVVLFTRRDADGKAYGVHLDLDKPQPPP